MVTLSLSSKLFNRAGRIRIHETTSSLLNRFPFFSKSNFLRSSLHPSLRIPDRYRGQVTASDSQHRVHVVGVGRFRQLCLLHVPDAKSGLRSGLGGGRPTRLDTVALRPRLHDRPGSGHIANFVVIDWRALPPRVSRPRLEHQHQLQLLLRVRRD